MSPIEAIVTRWSAISRSLPQFAQARPPHSRRRLRLRLEHLEDRTVLSSLNLPVTSLADNGPGTLRSAIAQADAGSAAQTYNIKFKVSGTITLESVLPDLSESMNLSGPGASRLTVQRDPRASSFFGIFVVDPGVPVKISGMTIAGGIEAHSGSGGGISNNGTLTVINTAISGNSAYDGGGVSNNGSLTLSHSRISSNQANQFGGGVYNNGTLTVSDTTISSNRATTGGGLYNSAGGQAEVDYSTINDSARGGLVNNAMGIGDNGSTVRLKQTVVDGVLYKQFQYGP